jgi:hypothetical protein
MRLTLLVIALVSCVFLTTERAEARPVVAEAKTQKAQKTLVKKKATKSAKAETSRKPKKAAREDKPVIRDDDDEPAPKAVSRKPAKQPLAQATDDEVPRNERSVKKTR